jgi:aspartokinase
MIMKTPISNITYCQNIALVTLPQVPCDSQIIGEILTAISASGVNVDMISQTAPQGGNISIAFSISMDAMGALLPVINALKPKYPTLKCEISGGMSKVNFYDADMVNTPGVAAKVFTLLSQVQVIMITTSTVDISILVREHELDHALALCEETLGIQAEEVAFG